MTMDERLTKVEKELMALMREAKSGSFYRCDYDLREDFQEYQEDSTRRLDDLEYQLKAHYEDHETEEE